LNTRERFQTVFNGEKPDRLPVIEFAFWWDKTLENWESQGMPKGLGNLEVFDYFGLDRHKLFWPAIRAENFPEAPWEGAPVLYNENDYRRLKTMLYSDDRIRETVRLVEEIRPEHESGETAVWSYLEGFFWYPRTLFGIENHLMAFYDHPGLMHEMNSDLADFNIKLIEAIVNVLKPEFITFAEDMSYNHGPMVSKEMFDEFMAPYYRKIVPLIKDCGVKVFIDTDGFVEPMISWFKEVGVEGIAPLERQAGVDVNRIRAEHPDFLLIGAFDKMTMPKGECAMREEFERILPAMKMGRYIPSVDHQTPPGVSFENYRIYISLLKEYAEKAVK